MKWIGQHIFDLISRFRTTVYLENLETSTETNILVVDSDGKVTKNADAGDDMSFTVEDGDTTDVVISDGKHWKFVEGSGININWTDTSPGSSADEYDLTFSMTKDLQALLDDAGNVIRGTVGNDVKIQSATNLEFQVDYDESTTPGTHGFVFKNGAGTTVAAIDESGIPTFAIGGKGSAAAAVVVDGGSGNLTSRTLAEFKSDSSLDNVDNKSSATIRGEIVEGNLPNDMSSGKVKQVCVTTHNFQMANTTGTVTYVPFNNLNENATGSSANYWTRTIAPYAGKVLRVGVRSDTALGTSCAIDVHKITDTTDDLNSGTVAQRVTGININTAHTTVNTDFSSAAFAAGDVVNVGLSRSAGTSAKVVVVVVWEYTL